MAFDFSERLEYFASMVPDSYRDRERFRREAVAGPTSVSEKDQKLYFTS